MHVLLKFDILVSSIKKGDKYEKNMYVDFFKSCRIYFNGEKFEFIGYGGRPMPTKTLSSDEESWINCWETMEKTGISVNPINGEPDYTCFIDPYYLLCRVLPRRRRGRWGVSRQELRIRSSRRY